MPDQPAPVWGLHHPNGAWYPFALYTDLDEATQDASDYPGYVPVKLVPAERTEAMTKPTPLWGLWSDQFGWSLTDDEGLRITNAECIAKKWGKMYASYVPVKLVPADALEASQARVAELERIIARMNSVTNVQTARGELGRKFHPLTCGNDSNHQPLYPICVGTEVHLKCADCDYVQANAGPANGDQPPC